MGTGKIQRGATSSTVAENVKRLRLQRGLSLRGLSEKLGECNHPLNYGAVDQIERGTRRVDVDDLMALAAALDVSPPVLLAAERGDIEIVSATGLGLVSARGLRNWVSGLAENQLSASQLVQELRRLAQRVDQLEDGRD